MGLLDRPEGFDPSPHPVVAELHRRLPGLRIGRTGAVTEAAFPTICEQKVTTLEAKRSWRAAIRRLGRAGARARPGCASRRPRRPSPDSPTGSSTASASSASGPTRSAGSAREAGRLDAMVALGPVAVAARLESIVGVGPWTSAEVNATALGDPDAVSVGDYHLPHQVSFALAGERRGSDERMLELLEPFRGHRQRVIRLILSSGLRPARRAPRTRPGTSPTSERTPFLRADLSPWQQIGTQKRGGGGVSRP